MPRRQRLAINTPYCPNCGWNRDAALTNARASLVTLPIGFAIMGGFFFFMIHFWRFRNAYQIAIFCVVPTVGILVNYIVMKRALSRLAARRPFAPRVLTLFRVAARRAR